VSFLNPTDIGLEHFKYDFIHVVDNEEALFELRQHSLIISHTK